MTNVINILLTTIILKIGMILAIKKILKIKLL